MEGVVQSFEGGLNKDLSKSIQHKNTYTDALNVQLTTDDGGTTGALINFKGNQSFVSIADTYPVYRLTLNGTANTSAITINGTASAGTFTSSATSTGLDIYNFVAADANLSVAGFGTSWGIAAGPNYAVVWGKTLNPSPTSAHTGFAITTNIVAQTNLDVIGYGLIREEIVLFTTNDVSSTGSYGQIWTLTYDKSQVKDSTGTPTLTLIYNQDIDFTKQYPICQAGQTVGNYENSSIKRIYWTDNFNKLRKLNVADIHAMALDPTELDVETPVSFSSPAVLQAVNNSGGVLVPGMYQASYRLKNSSGSETIFAEPSTWVPVYTALSSVGYENQVFQTTTTPTSKSLEWEITGLDTDFDTIEVVILYRASGDGIPDIYTILEEPMPASGIFNFTYTGSELTTPVDFLEYVSYATAFTHCKTIAAKDNRLFAANLRNETFDVTFDARAFRYTSSGAAAPRIATLTGTGGGSFSGITPTYPASTADAIQTYAVQRLQTINTGQRFQQDGVTLGGQGLNISYTFTTTTHHIDSKPATFATTSPYGYISRLVNADNTPYTINSITYPMDGYSANKSPFRHNLLKGYQREEMYRFAIVFYDRSGRPSPAKWIADIVMPAMFETDNAGAATTTFVIGDTSGFSSWAQAKNLGVIFTVSLANLSAADRDKITGYSIVRVKRDEDNKRIKGAGLLNPCGRSSSDAMTYNVSMLYDNVTTAGNYATAGGDNHSNHQTCATLMCPDFYENVASFKGFTAGDEIRLVGEAVAVISNTTVGGTTAYFRKYYTQTVLAARQEIALDQAEMCGFGERNAADLVNSTGFFDNVTKDIPNTGVTANSYSLGNNILFLETDNVNIDYATDGLDAGSNKFYALYYRPLTSQYGGSTFAQRAGSEYIFCGHFQPITGNTSSPVTTTIYGGDIFINSHDYQRLVANWRDNSLGTRAANVNWFTVETCINTDLNFSDTVNKVGLTLTSAGIDLTGETYSIHNVLKSEYDVRKYYSLPVSYTATTEYDCRVAFSEVKIAGETIDSWGVFKPNNFYDVESPHGPINNTLIVADKFLFWQSKAFGQLSINPDSLIQDLSGAELQLGTGDVIQTHAYITTEGGSKHLWGMSRGPDSVYWFDAIKRKLWKYSGEGLIPLSDLKGMHGWFNEVLRGRVLTTDNPVWQNTTSGAENGICATYDYENNRLFMTFSDSTVGLAGDVYTTVKNTITYNEQFDCFESFHSFWPTMYINDGHIILTRNPTSASTYKNLFIHSLGSYGTYYGTAYDSTITFVTNPSPVDTKVFDNYVYHQEVLSSDVPRRDSTFYKVRANTDYQNSDYVTLTNNTNLNRVERGWKLAVPRDIVAANVPNSSIFTPANLDSTQLFKRRMRDKYLTTVFHFANSSNYEMILHWIACTYRKSPH